MERAILHIPINIEWCYNLWIGQVQRDRSRHSDLIDTDIGIGRDDGTRREIDALAHEIATQSALLALEALRDGLERSARARHRHGIAGDRIGDQGRDMELQHVLDLGDDVRRRAVLLLLAQVGAPLEHVAELERQVVLRILAVVALDRWTHGRRRHRQHGAHHPVGPRVRWLEAKQQAVLDRDALEDRVYAVGLELLLLLDLLGHHLGRHLAILGRDRQALEPNERRHVAAALVGVLHVVHQVATEAVGVGVGLVGSQATVADALGGAQRIHCLEPLHGVFDFCDATNRVLESFAYMR